MVNKVNPWKYDYYPYEVLINTIEDKGVYVYRYKYIWMFVVMALIIMFVYTLISGISSAQTVNIYKTLVILPVFLSFPIFFLIYLIYMFLYSVRVDKTSVTIIVKGFSVNKFNLDEISKIQFSYTPKGFLYATVKLYNGKIYSFVSSLKNSWTLFYLLSDHCPPSGRPMNNPCAPVSSSDRPYPE